MQKVKHGIGKGLRAGASALDNHFVPVLVIAALVIISIMLVIQFATYQPERYTGFGLLNSNKEAGPFPANVSYAGSFTSYVTVSNREGNLALYQVDVYMGNVSTTIDPVKGVVDGLFIARHHQIVNDGQDWEQQVVINFNSNIAFLSYNTIYYTLWMYNGSSSTFYFTRQELHVHIYIF